MTSGTMSLGNRLGLFAGRTTARAEDLADTANVIQGVESEAGPGPEVETAAPVTRGPRATGQVSADGRERHGQNVAARALARRLHVAVGDPGHAMDSNSANALVAPGGIAARGEFAHAPLQPKKAVQAYGSLTVDQLNGPDDLRLRQMHRIVQKHNVETIRKIARAAEAEGLGEISVGGRAKTPASMFGKLAKVPGTKVSDISDIAGLRLELDPTKPGFSELKVGEKIAKAGVGEEMKLWRDFAQKPADWGYSGRVHYDATSAHGVRQEVQLGIKDTSRFIDQKLTTKGGDKISLHDVTGYKAQVYGIDLPPPLQKEYGQMMLEVNDAGKRGKTVAEMPELKARLDDFARRVEQHLPERVNQSKSKTPISSAAKTGLTVAKGLGVLGVAGGGVQVAQGVDQLQRGDKIEGGANVVAGGGSMVSGGAMLVGRMAAGTVAGGAVAMVDGARDIYSGIRDGDTEKSVVGSVKSGSGALMIYGAATLNPIAIGAGAVAYGGAVIYENWDAIAEAASESPDWARHQAESA